MIKNKKSLYFIVPIFIIVWAIVGIRIYRLFFSSDKRINPTLYSRIESKVREGEKRYEPTLDYPDPFLGTSKKVEKRVETIIKETPVEQNKVVVEKPPLSFIGIVSSVDNSKQAIVKYRNETLIVQNGDSIDHYKVCYVSSDSLVLSKGIYRWSYNLKSELNTD